jgi:hypothetical protein
MHVIIQKSQTNIPINQTKEFFMTTLNINVYKIVFPDGRIDFEFKRSDNELELGLSCKSLHRLTTQIKSEVVRFLRDNPSLRHASIDLVPFHDFDCPHGLEPRRCLPLNEAEANEFWEQYK